MIRIVNTAKGVDSCAKCYYGEYNGEKCNNEDCDAGNGSHYIYEDINDSITED